MGLFRTINTIRKKYINFLTDIQIFLNDKLILLDNIPFCCDENQRNPKSIEEFTKFALNGNKSLKIVKINDDNLSVQANKDFNVIYTIS